MAEDQFSQRPQTDGSRPSPKDTDPFLENLDSDPDALLADPNPPNTDTTPTVISKNKLGAGSGKTIQDPIANLQGKILAHFELIEPVGVGGMAAVLRARDTQLDRIVALKILPPSMAGEPENVRRFHQEARAAAKLDHENIARVFYCGEDDGLHFIAFEFVEGENLKALLERRGPLPVPEAINYMLQVATGLAHAAQRGVVHRDIKPSNIIITPHGRAKLVDMGLARSMELHDGRALTQSGVTLGTFEYISPEQALEPRTADVRSDIYSLGCTFYHALTGQPPVPEGTAAKKLHHHQYVAPVDPRQLNPSIPDEVAAILGRMMAKNPGHRYQRAEHLVQHLLQTAQRLGSIDQAPDSLLYVDTPLPNSPQKRPGLLIALALVALVGVVLLLSLSPPRSDHGASLLTRSPVPNADKPPASSTPAPPQAIKTKPVITAPHGFPISSEDDLLLAARSDSPLWLIHKDVHITREIRFQGHNRSLTIRSLNREKPARIILNVDVAALKKPIAGLRLVGGRVRLEDVDFGVKAESTPTVEVAAVAVEGVEELSCEGCCFFQEVPLKELMLNEKSNLLLNRQLVPIASLAIHHLAGTSRLVDLKRCWFEKGQAAVAIDGPATVSPDNCAFGPHCSLFHLYGDNPSRTSMKLNQCSAFVVYGPAFRIDGTTACRLDVRHSIFSRQEPEGVSYDSSLIHQMDARPGSETGAVEFHGQRNCYHNLNTFWIVAGSPLKTRQDLIEQTNSTDEKSKELGPAENPWKLQQPLLKLLGPDPQPRLAFQINPARSELWPVSEAGVEPSNPIGVLQCAWGKVYDTSLRPPIQVAKVEDRHEKIVDPTATGTVKGRIFKTLAGAIAEAVEGDTILIKSDGKEPLRVQLTKINAKLKNLTIKPYAGFRPVLTLDSEGSETHGALFRIAGGQVKFEKLQFLLQPEGPGFKSQSVVTFAGGGKCEFLDCAITLKNSGKFDQQVPLNAVSIPPIENKMAMPEKDAPGVPVIEVKGCLVRGQGTFLSLPQSGPFDIKMEDSLVALEGEFLSVYGDLPRPPTEAWVGSVRLTGTTTYLTDGLFHLVQDKGKTLIATESRATNCLFLAVADSPNPLIRLEGLESKDQRKRLLKPSGMHNAYCGFEKILEGQLAQPGMAAESIDSKKWYMAAVESLEGANRSFDRNKTVNLQGKSFAELLPADFQAALRTLQGTDLADGTPDLLRYGVDLDVLQSRLPLPPPLRPVVTPAAGPPASTEQE
jgi:serine/threonine protein kinase